MIEDHYVKTIEKLHSEILRLTGQNETFQDLVHSLREEIACLEVKIEELRQENGRLRSIYDDFSNQVSRLED